MWQRAEHFFGVQPTTISECGENGKRVTDQLHKFWFLFGACPLVVRVRPGWCVQRHQGMKVPKHCLAEVYKTSQPPWLDTTRASRQFRKVSGSLYTATQLAAKSACLSCKRWFAWVDSLDWGIVEFYTVSHQEVKRRDDAAPIGQAEEGWWFFFWSSLQRQCQHDIPCHQE